MVFIYLVGCWHKLSALCDPGLDPGHDSFWFVETGDVTEYCRLLSYRSLSDNTMLLEICPGWSFCFTRGKACCEHADEWLWEPHLQVLWGIMLVSLLWWMEREREGERGGGEGERETQQTPTLILLLSMEDGPWLQWGRIRILWMNLQPWIAMPFASVRFDKRTILSVCSTAVHTVTMVSITTKIITCEFTYLVDVTQPRIHAYV